MNSNETHEKTLLEKIQGLEEEVQLANTRKMEIITQRETKVKQYVETMKWKALVLERSTKVALFNQLFAALFN
jgi:hypothetical protein